MDNAEAKRTNKPKKTTFLVMAILFAIVAFGVIMLIVTLYTPPKETDISLQLKWIFNAGFAGDLVAKEKGMWKRIDVKVRPGGASISSITQVVSGQAEFGVATGDQLILAVAEGSPIIAIALAYQTNPLGWIVRADSGIKKPADLKGKTVGLSYIDDEPLFLAMIGNAGLHKDDVKVVRVGFDTSPFLKGDVDAFPVFRNTQGVEIARQLKKEGTETRIIGPEDVGTISYSNLYFVTKKFMKDHPEVVQEFVNGVIAGWRFAVEHPEETAVIVRKHDAQSSVSVSEASVRTTAGLVRPPDKDVRIGSMDDKGWESTVNVLVNSRQLKSTDVDIRSLYTMEFVNKAYDSK